MSDYHAFWKTKRVELNNPAITEISDGRYTCRIHFGWRQNIFLVGIHTFTHRGRTLYGDFNSVFPEYEPLRKWNGFNNRGIRETHYGAEALWAALRDPNQHHPWRNMFLTENQIGLIPGDREQLARLEAEWSYVRFLESDVVLELARRRFIRQTYTWLNERQPKLCALMHQEIETFRVTERDGEELFTPVA
jgi:hypothetical protein